MRLQSSRKVIVKNKIFGGEKILTCIPLVARNKDILLDQAREICELKPDVIEWRADYFETVSNAKSIVDGLIGLSSIIREIPLIFTLRHHNEGGQVKLTQDKRMEIIRESINTRHVDILDVEILNGSDFINTVRSFILEKDTKLILSYHNFNETPSEEFMLDMIREGEKLGADIVKIAVMPHNYGDVLKLLDVTYKSRSIINIPLISMSMGDIGVVTRMIGGLFGSDMTFAVGKESSAPGQISIGDINTVLDILGLKK